MDDGKEIVLEMTVTISKHVIQVFRQNKVNCHQFLKSNSSGSYRVDEVGGTYRLTGSYEGIKHIRMVLIKKLETFAAGEQRQPKANSLQNTKDTEQRVSTHKKRDDIDGDDVSATLLTSHKSVQIDVFDKHSQSAEGELSPDVTMEASLLKPKRIRKLKSPTPGGDASVGADAQTGLAESRVDDGRVLDKEKRKLSESGDICIEVDRDRHHYLTTHFKDELKKQLPPFHAFEAEGKYKVAFALNSKKNGGDAIRAKYKSFLDRFHFEIVRLTEGVDGSVLRSLVTSHDDKDSSFVLDEDNKTYKLIGKKNKIDKMKKLIEDHISEQLKPSKDTEGTWKVQNSKKKAKKTASTLTFCMEHGKLNRCESAQSSATKNRSLQVSLFDKTKAPATEAIVCAVDGKMQGFGDAKAAIEFESVKKYKDECRSIINEHHNSIPVGKVVHTTTTSVFQLKTKIKYIVHIVLEEKKASAASDVVMKDAIYRCLHHAENVLKTKSITFPHLGGSDYCDIGSFARGSVEALQLLSSTSHLQRVCFVVKDSKTLQELAAEFELLVDQQHNSQFTSSSESSYTGNSTSF